MQGVLAQLCFSLGEDLLSEEVNLADEVLHGLGYVYRTLLWLCPGAVCSCELRVLTHPYFDPRAFDFALRIRLFLLVRIFCALGLSQLDPTEWPESDPIRVAQLIQSHEKRPKFTFDRHDELLVLEIKSPNRAVLRRVGCRLLDRD